MTKGKLIILALVIVALVVVLVVWLGVKPNSGTTASTNTAETGTGTTAAGAPAGTTQTRAPAPQNIVVPGVGAQVSSSNVAAPQVVTPANSHSTSELRSFTITAEDGKFTPNTVIVNQNDVVNLVISAVGASYDFTQPDYGFHVSIPAGQSKTIQFGATASGQFTFYCASCGGPAKGPIGYIIVK